MYLSSVRRSVTVSIMKQAHLAVSITVVFYLIPYITKPKDPLIEKFKKACLLHKCNIFKLLDY